LPGTDQIPAELIQTVGNTLQSEIQKLINPIWNKEELPQQWKESIMLPVYKEGDLIDCSNCRGLSLLPIMCKTVFSVLPKLTPYMDKIIGYRQCGF
jgi:hypothetical protein